MVQIKNLKIILDQFNHFIKEQLNQSVALGVVVNRPKDLTREQLKEVKLLLDGNGYNEANLRSAVLSKPIKILLRVLLAIYVVQL
jgi:hypothetical protein